MIPVRALLTGSVLCFMSTIAPVDVLAVAQDPEAEPGVGATVAAWTLGTVLRAGAGYAAGRMSVRTGSVHGVVGAAAASGAVGYLAYFTLMASFAAAGGEGHFGIGDFLGLPVWGLQAALGGAAAAGLHRKRIRDEARSAAFAY